MKASDPTAPPDSVASVTGLHCGPTHAATSGCTSRPLSGTAISPAASVAAASGMLASAPASPRPLTGQAGPLQPSSLHTPSTQVVPDGHVTPRHLFESTTGSV